MYPAVVFVHGFLGFSEFRLPWTRVAYFRGVREALADLGVVCYFPRLPAGASVAERAGALAQYLQSVPQREIVIVAHSMGGLDSRCLIHKLDPEHRVRRLVTISTSHRGTTLADWAIKTPGPMNCLARLFGRRGLKDLSSSACERFNAEIPDREDVVYTSYAASRPFDELPFLFRRWARVVARAEGADNDSQVSVRSAIWGEYQGALTADHVELLGWNLARRRKSRPFDHIHFYRELVTRLLASYSLPAPPGVSTPDPIR